MASDRVTPLSVAAPHFSIASINSAGSRTPTNGSRPVAGRPLFFGFTVFDFGIFRFYLYRRPARKLALPNGPDHTRPKESGYGYLDK